jgi:hypothetical protein
MPYIVQPGETLYVISVQGLANAQFIVAATNEIEATEKVAASKGKPRVLELVEYDIMDIKEIEGSYHAPKQKGKSK